MANIQIADFLEGAGQVALGTLLGKNQADQENAEEEQRQQTLKLAQEREARRLQYEQQQQEFERQRLAKDDKTAGIVRATTAVGGARTTLEKSLAALDKDFTTLQSQYAVADDASKPIIKAKMDQNRSQRSGMIGTYNQSVPGMFPNNPEYVSLYNYPVPEDTASPTPAPGAPAATPEPQAPVPPTLALPQMAMGRNVLQPAEPRPAPTPFPRPAATAAAPTTPATPALGYKQVQGPAGVVRVTDPQAIARGQQIWTNFQNSLGNITDPAKLKKAEDAIASIGPLIQNPQQLQAAMKAIEDNRPLVAGQKAEAAVGKANADLSRRIQQGLKGLSGLPLTRGQQKALRDYQAALPDPSDPKYPKAANRLLSAIERIEPGARAAARAAEEKARVEERRREARAREDARVKDEERRRRERREDRREVENFAVSMLNKREDFSANQQQKRQQHQDQVRAERAARGGKGSKAALNAADREAAREILQQIKANPRTRKSLLPGSPDRPNPKFDPNRDRELRQKLVDLYQSRGVDTSNLYKQNPDLKPAAAPAAQVKAARQTVRYSPPGATRASKGYLPAPLKGAPKEVQDSALYALQQAEAKGLQPVVPKDGGVRSQKRQAEMKADQQQHPEKYPFPVAQPGLSMHQTGTALDVTAGPGQPTLERQRALAHVLEPLGWKWAGEGDMVHFQYVGTSAQKPAKADAAGSRAQALAAPFHATLPAGIDAGSIPSQVEAFNHEGTHVWVQGRWRPFQWVNGQFRMVNPATGQPFPAAAKAAPTTRQTPERKASPDVTAAQKQQYYQALLSHGITRQQADQLMAQRFGAR